MQPQHEKTFKAYWVTLSSHEKKHLACAAKTSRDHLSQVAHGHRRAGISLITRLCATDPNITQEMLRPDLFMRSSN